MRPLAMQALVSFAAFAAYALAAPHHVVHEKRHISTDTFWTKGAQLDPAALLPFRIGLKQSNLERGDGWLMEISDPASPKYGQHWTPEQVIEAFRPSEATVQAVHDWLVTAGIATERHRLSEAYSWLEFTATAKEAESVFNAKYHVFSHDGTGTQHIACDEYSLPAHIQSHVDFITPGVHFDAKTRTGTDEYYDGEGNKIEKRQTNPWSPGPPGGGPPGWPHNPWPGPYPHWPNPHGHPPPPNPNICNDSFVTPYCLRTLYGIPSDLPAVEGNSVGIVEYTPESFLQSDIDKFFELYEPQAKGEQPVFDSIDGGFLYLDFNMSNPTELFQYLGEPSLDLQYSMALLYPQDVVLYQVGDFPEQNKTSFNNFLDAIDKSYCTYDGGDSKKYDATYPDKKKGGYDHPENCGRYAPAKVISTSYGYDEIQLPAAYEQRQCHEYMKLGMMGVTFTYSSGDDGVAGGGGVCYTDAGKPVNGYKKSATCAPSFPPSGPYVLAVGATQILNGTNDVAAAVQAGKQPEVCMELTLTPQGLIGYDFPPNKDPVGTPIFSSGGGFSNVFALPSYQKSAVTLYNQKYAPDYGTQYNRNGSARGIPDVAANGAWYSVVIGGMLQPVFGTSCSSPTFASVLGLINGQRIKKGKSTVGFVNPTLYAHPEVLHDVTGGRNPGCRTAGFACEPGWDPVTGLGTPNFPKMMDLFMSLP